MGRDDARGARRRSASRSWSATRGGRRRDDARGSRRRASVSRSRSRSASRRPRHRESERSGRHRSRPREERRRHRDDRSRSRSREPRKRRRRADSRAEEKRSRSRARDRKAGSRRDSNVDKKEQTDDKEEAAIDGEKQAERSTEATSKEKVLPASIDADSQGRNDDESSADAAATSTEADGDVVMGEASDGSPETENADSAAHSSQEQPKPSAASAAAVVPAAASASSTTASSAPATPPPSSVDVKSIKMDILKALAEARSTIAGIKGATLSEPANSTKAAKPTVQPVYAAARSSGQQKLQSPKKIQDVDHSTVLAAPEKKPEESAPLPQKKASASAAEEFDMFAMAELDDEEAGTLHSDQVVPTIDVAGLQLNCDDVEGYYNTTVGEVLNGKYRVLGSVGKGVFSTVLRCQCVPPLPGASGEIGVVAVKLIRNNDVMREAAQTEVRLLNELAEKDPRDKKHCVRLLDTFSHRSHVALVFEPMQMNLREAMKKFGGKSGISIQAVRVFSKHMLIALNHLDACGIIHAGKPLDSGDRS
jgi:serine/threonine-protein kinase PRP4